MELAVDENSWRSTICVASSHASPSSAATSTSNASNRRSATSSLTSVGTKPSEVPPALVSATPSSRPACHATYWFRASHTLATMSASTCAARSAEASTCPGRYTLIDESSSAPDSPELFRLTSSPETVTDASAGKPRERRSAYVSASSSAPSGGGWSGENSPHLALIAVSLFSTSRSISSAVEWSSESSTNLPERRVAFIAAVTSRLLGTPVFFAPPEPAALVSGDLAEGGGVRPPPLRMSFEYFAAGALSGDSGSALINSAAALADAAALPDRPPVATWSSLRCATTSSKMVRMAAISSFGLELPSLVAGSMANNPVAG